MSEFITVAKVGEIPAGEGRAYPISGRMVAVFFVDGKYTAMYDVCPHMGASLATGYVEDGCVSCPWHAWRFSVETGCWMDSPKSKIQQEMYEVRVEGPDIQVRLSLPPV